MYGYGGGGATVAAACADTAAGGDAARDVGVDRKPGHVFGRAQAVEIEVSLRSSAIVINSPAACPASGVTTGRGATGAGVNSRRVGDEAARAIESWSSLARTTTSAVTGRG